MDFAFSFASLSFKFLEDVFQVLEEAGGHKIKFIYSTVDEYITSIKS